VHETDTDNTDQSLIQSIATTDTDDTKIVDAIKFDGDHRQVRLSVCRQRLDNLIEYKREQWHRAARFACTLQLLDDALNTDPTFDR
jgi:hypothetical protein